MDFSKFVRKYEDKGADYIDARVRSVKHEKISLEGENPSIKHDESKYYSVRTLFDGGIGLSFTSNDNEIEDCFRKAFKLAKLSSKYQDVSLSKSDVSKEKVSLSYESPFSISKKEKMEKLFQISSMLDKEEVSNKDLSFNFVSEEKNFVNSEGTEVQHNKTYEVVSLNITGKRNGSLEHVGKRIAKSRGWNYLEGLDFQEISKKLYDRLLNKFKAKPCPAKRMPIVIDKELAGVFFHEALGHACEADSIIKGISVLEGRMGEKIAPEHLSISDDPTYTKELGYFPFDDEGVKGRENFLIKDGVLDSFLQSKETAFEMDTDPTGNGRSQSPKHFPIPRMSNIIVKKGSSNFDEMISTMDKGIYAKGTRGGVVNPTNGNFFFNARGAFLIEDGEIGRPLKGVSFAGNILETLKEIELIGKDPSFSPNGGFCGKSGQMVPVSSKAPNVKVREAIVGGRP